MKIRNGFVSNSSSSSFIIGFPRMPESAHELHSWMFPEGPISITTYDWMPGVTSEEAAKIVFNDIQGQNPLSYAGIAAMLHQGEVSTNLVTFPPWPDTWNLPKGEREAVHKKYEEDTQAAADKLAEIFTHTHAGKVFFDVSYSDNDGPVMITMEHGDVFRNIPFARISNH